MIAQNMLELVGRTPLVRLNRVCPADGAEVVVKLESRNPSGSVKDRAAWAMLMAAQDRIGPDTLLVEPTSGNTGIGLAFVCAVRGWRLILVMPENMSLERRALLKGMGAELVLTPASEGMGGSVRKAEAIVQEHPGAILVGQFDNPANREVHRRTTAEEIWADTDGRVDAFVAGVGSGGTVCGTGSRLKELNPALKVVAVEPAESPLLSAGVAGPHGIQGIGANFVPGNYDRSVVDEILTATEDDAYAAGRALARTEGILAGITSGAALWAAEELARRPENQGKLIVALLPDSGERYLSTPLFRD